MSKEQQRSEQELIKITLHNTSDQDLNQITSSTDPSDLVTIERVNQDNEDEPKHYTQEIDKGLEIETPLCGICCCKSYCVIF